MESQSADKNTLLGISLEVNHALTMLLSVVLTAKVSMRQTISLELLH